MKIQIDHRIQLQEIEHAQSLILIDHMYKCKDVYANPAFFISANMVVPNKEGDGATATPAASNASIFDFASPFPPIIIAPACPIRRPGGAVTPHINPHIGFLLDNLFDLIQSAATSSALPPISPINIMPFVSGSSLNFSKVSIKLVPLNGSPPIPTTVDCPRPTSVV